MILPTATRRHERFEALLSPGPDSGEMKATLKGELGTILEWVAQRTTNTARTKVRGVPISVVAGARFSRDRHVLQLLFEAVSKRQRQNAAISPDRRSRGLMTASIPAATRRTAMACAVLPAPIVPMVIIRADRRKPFCGAPVHRPIIDHHQAHGLAHDRATNFAQRSDRGPIEFPGGPGQRPPFSAATASSKSVGRLSRHQQTSDDRMHLASTDLVSVRTWIAP